MQGGDVYYWDSRVMILRSERILLLHSVGVLFGSFDRILG